MLRMLDLEPDGTQIHAYGLVAKEVPATEMLYRRIIDQRPPEMIEHDPAAADAANTPAQRAMIAEQQNSPSAMALGPEVTFGITSRDFVIGGVLLLGWLMLRRKKLV